jgi:hypothetical protein
VSIANNYKHDIFILVFNYVNSKIVGRLLWVPYNYKPSAHRHTWKLINKLLVQ